MGYSRVGIQQGGGYIREDDTAGWRIQHGGSGEAKKEGGVNLTQRGKEKNVMARILNFIY